MKINLGRLKKNLVGETLWIKRGIKCHAKWYGNTYGGFYVHPELVHKDSIVYSFGIGEDTSFDTAMIQAFDCSIFAFDPTPKSIEYVKNQNMDARFHFEPVGIGATTTSAVFYLPKNKNHVSGSITLQKNVEETNQVVVALKNIEDIIASHQHTHIDVLKMDIEGAEYDVLPSIFSSKTPIHQLLLEFHERLFPNGKELTKKVIALAKENGYEVFAYSPTQEEISFIKKELLNR